MPSYELSELAVEDLLAIQKFIERESVIAAEKLIDQFFATFDYLAQWPNSGHTRTDLTSRKVLFWPVGSYLIVYREKEDASELQIVAVLHAARDIPSLLEDR